ncbi:MAG: hypothetical protein ACI9KK_002486 [Ascidiaceihabitans sp.]|jgi:hypothetical protein
MSVLSFPRIILNGTTSWNVATNNNKFKFGYDKGPIDVHLPQGVQYDTFDDWLIALNDQGTTNGDWGVFGQMHANFDASVKNIVTGYNQTEQNDGLNGATLKFIGGVPKLVDVDPYSPITSQIFLRNIMLQSDNDIGFSGPATARMTSRRPFFSRNVGSSMQIAGGMGVVWQTCIAKADLIWNGLDKSSFLASLKAMMDGEDVQGLMMRVSSFSTLYFTNYVDGGWQTQTAQEVYGKIAAKWAAVSPVNPGNIAAAFNPAVSTMCGAIGLWQKGDLQTVPSGRILAAAPPPSQTAATLGGAEAYVNSAQGVISLDLMNTIPIDGAQNETKSGIGPLALTLTTDGSTQTINALAESDFRKSAYFASGGIIDVPLGTVSASDVLDGTLGLSSPTNTVTPLEEVALTAEVDQRSIYVDMGNPGQFIVDVRASTGTVPADTKVFANIVTNSSDKVVVLTGGTTETTGNSYPVTNGQATVTFDGQDEGNCIVLLQAFTGVDVPVTLAQFPAPTTGYAAIRVMPTDADINAVADADVTWDYVYNNVLRPFDLVYRGMSCGVFSLGSQDAVKAHANSIVGLTDLSQFESPLYMPVTRDLSAGRRALLWRYLGFNDTPPST